MIPAPLLEIAVLALGMVILMIEAFVGKIDKRVLAFVGIIGLAIVFCATFFVIASSSPGNAIGFWSFYTADRMAIFFKQFALLTTMLVLVMIIDYAPLLRSLFVESKEGRLPSRPEDDPRWLGSRRSLEGFGEFVALPLFACAGL